MPAASPHPCWLRWRAQLRPVPAPWYSPTHASTGDRARYIGKNSDKNAEKTSIRSCRLAAICGLVALRSKIAIKRRASALDAHHDTAQLKLAACDTHATRSENAIDINGLVGQSGYIIRFHGNACAFSGLPENSRAELIVALCATISGI